MPSPTDLQALRGLPKVELHRHLDGSVRFETIQELSRLHHLDLGAGSEEELKRKTKILSPMRDLSAVLESFGTIQRVLCSYEAIRRISFENVEDAYRDGVKLAELRFAPAFIAAGKELANEEIIEGVLDGIALGMARYPIQVGLIGILPRTFPLEANRKATEDLIRYARSKHRCADRICGFDLADSEADTRAEDFLPLVERAREAGLGITVHSGENTDAGFVEKTLELFRPARLGHGIKIWGNLKLMDRVRRQGIMLEICPTSNWLTRCVPSLEEHPLPGLYREGILVSINSDDPQLMGIDLVHEYELCTRLYGFGQEDFLRINQDSVRCSFLPENVRNQVLERFFQTPTAHLKP